MGHRLRKQESSVANLVKAVAGKADAGSRLDRFLAERATDFSRSRLKQLLLEGEVRVGARTIKDPAYRVKSGDTVELRVPPPRPAKPVAQKIPLNIVYEDSQLIVIDKPAGLVVHPAAGNEDGTLVNALIAHCGKSLSGIGGEKRPGIVHRLDKDTSGLIVVAKNDKAHRALSEQFADHGRTGPLVRAYLALVWGVPEPRRGVINAPIGRDPRARERMAVLPGGRKATTYYELRERYAGENGLPVVSLIECRLATGRNSSDPRPSHAVGPPSRRRRSVRRRVPVQDFADAAACAQADAALPASGAARIPARLFAPANRKAGTVRKPAA